MAENQNDFWGIDYLPGTGSTGTNNITSETGNFDEVWGGMKKGEFQNETYKTYQSYNAPRSYLPTISLSDYQTALDRAWAYFKAGEEKGAAINHAYSSMMWDNEDYWKTRPNGGSPTDSPPAQVPTDGSGSSSTSTGGGGGGGGGEGDFSGGGGSGGEGDAGAFPGDIGGLRGLLAAFFSEAVKNGALAYPGSTTVNTPSQLQDAYNRYSNQQYGAESLFNQLGQERQSIGEGFNKAIEPGQFDPVYKTLSALMGYKGEDVSKGIEAIDTQGKLAIEDQLAAITEKYSQLGLGAGSDISSALAQGASRGIADMNVSKQNMLIQNLQNAANMRLNSADKYGGTKASELAMMIQALTGQANAQVGMANAQVGAGNLGLEATKGLERFGLTEYDIQKGNMERSYEQWLNQYKGHPLLPLITQFATASGNAAPAAIPEGPGTGAMLGSAAITGGLGSMSVWLPLLISAFSDREMKEDIVPLDHGEVSKKLADLPIYRWRYKGDKTQHMGPMAQDFQKTFGVGDGKMLHLVDVMGVLLASQKELVKRA